MIFYLAYILSIALHLIAFYWGIKTLYIGDNYFNQTCIKDFFSSYRERKHVATVFGTIGNMFFILAKIPYLVLFGGHSTGAIEGIFTVGHVTVAAALAIYHYNALDLVKKELV